MSLHAIAVKVGDGTGTSWEVMRILGVSPVWDPEGEKL
jgi:hypothetical protein